MAYEGYADFSIPGAINFLTLMKEGITLKVINPDGSLFDEIDFKDVPDEALDGYTITRLEQIAYVPAETTFQSIADLNGYVNENNQLYYVKYS